MRSFPQQWDDPSLDEAEREYHAQQSIELANELVESDGWKALTDALRLQVADCLNDLARSSKDDEQNRGVIRALNHVLEMPENLIRAASSELQKHR